MRPVGGGGGGGGTEDGGDDGEQFLLADGASEDVIDGAIVKGGDGDAEIAGIDEQQAAGRVTLRFYSR
jgi:hypothetical protein